MVTYKKFIRFYEADFIQKRKLYEEMLCIELVLSQEAYLVHTYIDYTGKSNRFSWFTY